MDLDSGKVYHINDAARSIIELGEKGLPVDDIVKKLNRRIEERSILAFIKDLAEQDLIVLSRTPRKLNPVKKPKPMLNFLWLELTPDCNLRCIHCYATAGKEADPLHVRGLSTAEVKGLITEAAGLGCRRIQFTGGEPLLRADLTELIDHAIAESFEVEVFTNGNLLTEPLIKFFLERGVRVATTIFSHRAETHDAITKVPGSFEKTMNSIKLLLAYGVPLRCAVVAMKQNEGELEETNHLLAGLGILQRPPDPIRPTGRGKGMENWPRKYGEQSAMTRPAFSTSKEGYEKNISWNSCWFGKAAITSTGDMLPCVFARDQVVGNVRKGGLKQILGGKAMLALWGLTKDKVEVCRDCEYRYACEDCRPWAYGFTDNLYAKSPRCTYDPYTGEWHKTWKVPGRSH